jgi:hypothetical protein
MDHQLRKKISTLAQGAREGVGVFIVKGEP